MRIKPRQLEKIKNIKFYSNDLNREITIKEYLKELLRTLWIGGESFSGKRPFGNSGWEYDLYLPLIKENIIIGSLDEFECIDSCDTQSGSIVILEIINSL